MRIQVVHCNRSPTPDPDVRSSAWALRAPTYIPRSRAKLDTQMGPKLDSKLEHKRALRETAEAKEKAENEKRLLTSQKSEKRYEYKSWQKEMGADLVAEFNGDVTACVRWVRDPDSHLR